MAFLVNEKKYQQLEEKYTSLLHQYNEQYTASKDKESAQEDLLKKTRQEYKSRISLLETKLRAYEERLLQADKAAEAHKEELVKIQACHLEEISAIRKKHTKELQRMAETIEGKKEKLQDMNEKDLLIEAMMAIQGYTSRIERLEQSMNSHKLMIEPLNNQRHQIIELFQPVLVKIKDLERNIKRIIESLNIESQFQSIRDDLDYIKCTTDNIEATTDELEEAINNMNNNE